MIEADMAREGAQGYAGTVLNAMPSAVLAVDKALAIAFLNPAAEQLFGISRTVLMGRPLAELLPFDSPLFDLIRRVDEAGSGVSDYGVALLLSRGESHLVDLHVSLLDERRGDHLVVLHPCSVAQRLNRQLSHRGGARAVASLGATLAHEVKNPLSGIRGAAQLLEPGVAEDERPLIRLICDETDRICALVDRMEAFADGKPIERRPVNIYQVLERVRRVSDSGFGRRVGVVERYDPSLPEVDGDHDQLVQVFLNLIKNAAEAVPADGGEIRISTHYTHGLSMRVANSRERVELPILVEIRDNGPGVSEEMVAHLFEPFVSSKRAGTGLGLSLAAKIVGDHGGVIEFQNQASGALFRVRLPAWRAPGRPAV
jgi:two-component system nitrogen regulation sensor histidine kinase GlnL